MNRQSVRAVLTIIDKEWKEVFKNRMVVFTVALLPLIFTVMPLVMIYAMNAASGSQAGDMADIPASFMAGCGSLSAADCMQMFLINQFLLLFMMTPLAVPVAIAAYSVVGEKTTRSLEPLLATPITTEELLLGKSAAAAIPAILATWAGFAIFLAVSPLVGLSPAVHRVVAGPVWLTAVLAIGPLMAVMAVNFAVIVSSRVSDPRVAEQVSMVIIVPLLGLVFAQLGGLIIINMQLMVVSIAILLAVDAGLIYAGARLFQRETILTRWK